MIIRRYTTEDETALFALMKNEGAEWEDYWGEENHSKYITALKHSITYVAVENNSLCGYCRCRDDDGYGIYVYDLLVDKAYRGKQIGRQLMARVCTDFSDDTVYVMSDVDGYYEKQDFTRAGSIFEVCL